jgi:peptidase M23-like protein
MRPTPFICSLFAALHLLSGTALAAGGWTWPVRGPVLTHYRNGADPYAAGQHRGIDIGAPVGAPVVAAAPGTVTFVGVVGSSGLTVSERSADGRYDLSYLHLSAAGVRRGDAVSAGVVLGAVGTSGRRSSQAPHLHFGVREAGSRTAYRDPLDFLAPPPAGRAPEPVPAPVPVAEPATPEPAPVAPVGAPVPAPEPGVPAPASERLPVSAPGGSATPVARDAAAHGAHSHGLPAGHGAPSRGSLAPGLSAGATPAAAAGAGTAAPAGGPSANDRPVPAGPRSPSSSHAASAAQASRPHGTHPDTGGIDLAWLAACLGLVAAATALGHPDQTRKLAARSRTGLAALLRRRRGSAEWMRPQTNRQ